MVIHKLIATCECGKADCPGVGGALVNITFSANDKMDIDFLVKLLGEVEGCVDRIEEVVISQEQLPIMRGAIEDCYSIPKFTEQLMGKILKPEEPVPPTESKTWN